MLDKYIDVHLGNHNTPLSLTTHSSLLPHSCLLLTSLIFRHTPVPRQPLLSTVLPLSFLSSHSLLLNLIYRLALQKHYYMVDRLLCCETTTSRTVSPLMEPSLRLPATALASPHNTEGMRSYHFWIGVTLSYHFQSSVTPLKHV